MSNDAPGAATSGRATDFEHAEQSEPFQRLKRSHRSFVFPLGVAFLVWYFAYVLGLAQFVTTFAITTWYVSYSNRKLDPLADEIRADLASGGHAEGGIR
jgi:uncharacterized membrane protein (DUF485 family)